MPLDLLHDHLVVSQKSLPLQGSLGLTCPAPLEPGDEVQLFGTNSAIIYVNSMNLNSSNKFQFEFNKFEFRQLILSSIWNNYNGSHQHRVDLITQNSKLDTHVEDSHYVEHSVYPTVVQIYNLVYDQFEKESR